MKYVFLGLLRQLRCQVKGKNGNLILIDLRGDHLSSALAPVNLVKPVSLTGAYSLIDCKTRRCAKNFSTCLWQNKQQATKDPQSCVRNARQKYALVIRCE
jgi:hypothetical protein